jgi:nitrilase
MPGAEDDFILNGGSAVIGPDASYLAGPVFDASDIIYAELELECITEGQLFLDTNGHYARPDVFHLEVNDQPQLGVVFGPQQERR